jgi:9-cis-beta-carotene 9',10'-cleaving dioxygenase
LIVQSPADIQDPDIEISKLRELAEEAFWDYQFLFRAQRNEVESIPLTVVEGAVPDDLAGVYYLCGPGILSDDHGSQVHPLDGHGYLRKFLFTGASCPVMYSARYLVL